jgi:glycosyltransferase involved in cell wall biosynthesis
MAHVFTHWEQFVLERKTVSERQTGTYEQPPTTGTSIPELGDEFNIKPPAPEVELAPVNRVALIAEGFLPKFDGVSKTALLTLRHLQLTGREVVVFAPDTAPTTIGPTRVIPVPSLGMPLYPEKRVALPNLAIHSYLEDFQPDLIQLFSPAMLSFSAAVAGRIMRVPVVGNYQTDLPGYADQYGYPLLSAPLREGLKFMHNLCHLTLAPSTATIREIESWGFRRVRHWARGVNTTRFDPARRSAEWRERLLNGRPADSLLCLYVGRLAREKRLDLLLEVAALPGVALTIVGDGPIRDEIKEEFAGTDAYLTGYLFGDELAMAYAASDVFVFTGTNETFGQVVLEALSSGLPVVVPDSGGVTDMAIPGETGIICETNPADFAAAVRRLRDQPALRRYLAEGARLYAQARPWEALMAQLEGYYTEAVNINDRFNRLHTGPLPTNAWLEELTARHRKSAGDSSGEPVNSGG